jgi:Flp pilus assembly protein TadD
MVRAVVAIWLFCVFSFGQQLTLAWQDDLRGRAEAKDWAAAMAIVDREVALAPKDMDVRAWRARVLTWSGRLAEAESEYRNILTIVSNDPDIWLGLAAVYSREGRTKEALQALDRAAELDPKRSDIQLARAAALRVVGLQDEAKFEVNRALDLDPRSAEGRTGLVSSRDEFRHELVFSTSPMPIRMKGSL